MPELPEVETVRRGLEPWLLHARIDKVRLNRADLRFPFPDNFAAALEGSTIEGVGRRAKYLLFTLSNGWTWLSHLGMTGSYRFAGRRFKEPSRYYEPAVDEKHDHLVMELTHPKEGKLTLTGFGTFQVEKRKARVGRNPRTGKEIKIPATKVVKFRPGKLLKDAVK